MAKKRAYVPKFTEPDEPVIAEGADSPPDPGTGPGRPPTGKSKQRYALSKFTTDDQVVDVWERRLLNPNEQTSPKVRIKTPGMKLRWVNLAQRGRYQRARDQGWVPVERDEIYDEREIYGISFDTTNCVCRGEKQSEMLMKMPEAVWRKIQARKGELTRASYKNLKSAMASAGAAHFSDRYNTTAGDMAAEAASKFKGNVSFGEERLTSDEFLAGDTISSN